MAWLGTTTTNHVGQSRDATYATDRHYSSIPISAAEITSLPSFRFEIYGLVVSTSNGDGNGALMTPEKTPSCLLALITNSAHETEREQGRAKPGSGWGFS